MMIGLPFVDHIAVGAFSPRDGRVAILIIRFRYYAGAMLRNIEAPCSETA